MGRLKFSNRERLLLKFFFKLSIIGSNNVIIDNKHLINYIDEKYHHKVIYVTYGVNNVSEVGWDQEIANYYSKASIESNEYWLAVARLQPDNNIETIMNGFIKSGSNKTLIIIGDFSCDDDYEKALNTILNNNIDKKIIFTRGIYDQQHLNMFRQNCFGYIHAHSKGGTNPSLLEAMIMKNIIIAHDNEFNKEVAGDSIIYFKDFEELKNKIELIESNPKEFMELKEKSYKFAKNNHNWEDIVHTYSDLFKKK